MVYTIYQCDPIGFLEMPRNETAVASAQTFSEARRIANAMKLRDREHGFTVGIGTPEVRSCAS